jgi:RHS repeat-associated protein
VVGAFSYYPYGGIATYTGTVLTQLRYDGQYQDDESTLYYLRARYYNPNTGQFTSRDPLEASTADPYGYADGDPVDLSDPSGLCWSGFGAVCDAANSLAGATYGALTSGPGRAVGSFLEGIGNTVTFGGTEQIANAISSGATCTEDKSSLFYGGGVAFGIAALAMTIDGTIGVADNPLAGTTYTQKILDQMGQDAYHGFPSLIDTLPTRADLSSIRGGDGAMRRLVSMPGSINGTPGRYEWIIERDGSINHRHFNPR